MKTLLGDINLSRIDKDNVYVDKNGDEHLSFKIIFKDGKYDSIAFMPQNFFKENQKDSNGNWVKTPILGNVKELVYKKEDESIESDTKDLPF